MYIKILYDYLDFLSQENVGIVLGEGGYIEIRKL